MQNEENNQNKNSKLKRVILELKQISENVKDGVVDYVRRPIDNFSSVFTRKNVVNAIMPRFLALGVNKLFDTLGNGKKKKDSNSDGEENKETIKTSTNSEESIDEDIDADLLEDLIDAIDNGFGETNENLKRILMIIGGQQTSFHQKGSTPLLLGYSDKTKDSTAEILEGEVLEIAEDTNQVLVDILDINGKIVKTLQAVEKNTRVDSLKQREDELETSKKHILQRLIENKNNRNKDETKNRLIEGILSDILRYAIIRSSIGKFGGKLLGGVKGAAGSILSSVKGAVGSTWQGTKTVGNTLLSKNSQRIQGAISGVTTKIPGPLKALGLLGTSTIASTPTLALPAPTTFVPTLPAPIAEDKAKIVSAVAPSATKSGGIFQSVKNLGGKLLGTPLTVGLGAYEAYNISQDENLSSEQKTKEFSKIGGKTVGAIAGAKTGASIGAIGGPIGAAIGGVIGGIGGYFLGEKGGEIVGNIINAIAPSSETIDSKVSNKFLAKNADVTKISSKPSEIPMNSSIIDVSDIVNPKISAITPGQTKTNTLQMLTQQIEQTNAEKQEMKASPTIIAINNNSQSNVTNGSQDILQRQRNPIPIVRNQDGTIQRLLDLNYMPLLIT